MSTHIIDQVAASKVSKERSGYTDDYYFLAMLSGDNNVFDCLTDRRARHWRVWAVGSHYRCLQEACLMASEFCGGMAKMVRGKSSPESFIKHCRGLLDTAREYDDPYAPFRVRDLAITFSAEEKAARKWAYERLLQKGPAPELRDRPYYTEGKVEAFPFDLTAPRSVAAFLEHLPNKQLWHHLKISGPGEV